MTNTGFWNTEWMNLQRQYWENWSAMSQKALGLAKPERSPWEQAMDHWWEAVSPATPLPAAQFMQKIMTQGKMFFHLAEEFARNLKLTKDAGDWTTALQNTLADMHSAFMNTAHPSGDDALHKMMAFWELPLDNWQRMASSLSPAPGDLLRNMPHGGTKAALDRFLTAPGLGYTREEQAQYQLFAQRVLEYQEASTEYAQFFSRLGVMAVERMQLHVAELTEQGTKIDSARLFYDLWVSSCEEAYSEQVMTPEYAKLNGRLVNALMALKKQMSVMVDEALGLMNMPTRVELRTLQDRVQEQRRDNKALKAELEGLRQQIAKLARPAAKPRGTTAPKRKTTPRPATSRKPRAATPKS